ncbi:MAG: TetR/AcrR family transcriptional regulator [Sandaracinaceae bacterium]
MSDTDEVDGRSRRAARKRAERRRKVLDTALGVFSEKGYHQTRVTDIIDAAQISRGTFYLYFDSKNAIFHEILDQLLAEIRANMVGVDLEPGAPPVRDQLFASVRRILRMFRQNPGLTRVVLREAVGLDEEVDRKLRAFYVSLHAWLVESLQNGQTMGFIRPLDPDPVAWCILGSVKELLERMVEDEGAEERLALVVMDYNLQGILAG